jgi:hypothetical protein
MKTEEKTEGIGGGYTVPDAGTYIHQFQEGIDLWQKEGSEAVQIAIPTIIDRAVSGAKDDKGKELADAYLVSRKDESPR